MGTPNSSKENRVTDTPDPADYEDSEELLQLHAHPQAVPVPGHAPSVPPSPGLPDEGHPNDDPYQLQSATYTILPEVKSEESSVGEVVGATCGVLLLFAFLICCCHMSRRG